MKNEELCPCKSSKTFGECCGPIIAGEKKPSSPEEVMRARYSAYVTESVDYLKSSSTKAVLKEFDEEAYNEKFEKSKNKKLKNIEGNIAAISDTVIL